MKLGSATKIDITPNEGTTRFQFRLWFPERQLPVEFEISAYAAMVIMNYFQKAQVRHKLPIPRSSRPYGKPKLSLVLTEE
jgi:hypothetical protein